MVRDFKGLRRYRRRLRKGLMNRPRKCSQCGRKGIIEGHHSDYSKPMKVIWLCQSCHSKLHQK